MDGESRRKRRNGLDELEDEVPEAEEKRTKKRRTDSDAEDSSEEDDDMDETETKTRVSGVGSSASGWRPGGKGIHRDTSRPMSSGGKRKMPQGKQQQQKGKSSGAGDKKVQPYAYIPLKQKTAKQDVRKILKANRKSGKGKMKISTTGAT
ncbi:hypothetical protein WR25_14918 [Diploscapter pachys]|uniref:Uncharacterized protein n=1 Tax=Diploscapter pachys TaxID=2018661 RepID=A0A2A2J232_9BILA|nr:hypothetical protein WR25_14918 [Diploscapter pachys]